MISDTFEINIFLKLLTGDSDWQKAISHSKVTDDYDHARIPELQSL